MARAPRSASVVTTLPVADLATARRGHRRSSGELVAEHIRRLIFEGSLKQGDHLRQDEIAAELGVSRIPVREAVIALDREGWLMIEPHRGAFVHGLDENAVHDHYDVFGLIFGLTARRATERASDEGIAELVGLAPPVKAASGLRTASSLANNEYLRRFSGWQPHRGSPRSAGCCATSSPATSSPTCPVRWRTRSAASPPSPRRCGRGTATRPSANARDAHGPAGRCRRRLAGGRR